MKYITTLAFISVCIFSYAQSNMFWNNYSNFNPAMSGFQYEQHAALTYTNNYPSLAGNYSDINGNVNSRIANHHGVGINYTGHFSPTLSSNKVLANYNYQIDLDKAGKLAIGTGVGYGHYDVTAPYLPTPTSQEKSSSFELNLGAAYNWKNIIIGFSGTNLTPPKGPIVSFAVPRSKLNLHAQYNARIAEKFQLTPRVLYTYQDGFHEIQPNLTLTYLDKFSIGVSSQLRDNFGVNVGWDILNKFRVAYNYSQTISKLNNAVSGGIHEFAIGYILKSTKSVKLSGTPNF